MKMCIEIVGVYDVYESFWVKFLFLYIIYNLEILEFFIYLIDYKIL